MCKLLTTLDFNKRIVAIQLVPLHHTKRWMIMSRFLLLTFSKEIQINENVAIFEDTPKDVSGNFRF